MPGSDDTPLEVQAEPVQKARIEVDQERVLHERASHHRVLRGIVGALRERGHQRRVERGVSEKGERDVVLPVIER